ncbi:MAG: type II toxin-antitoxin system Phd/YefM family antitoxin [Noviherbaspirillum sp.]
MADFSIAQARDHFPKLVQEAEKGQLVRITRRGIPVAVLLSEQEYSRLSQRPLELGSFLQNWRGQMRERQLAFMSEEECSGLRETKERPAVDFP